MLIITNATIQYIENTRIRREAEAEEQKQEEVLKVDDLDTAEVPPEAKKRRGSVGKGRKSVSGGEDSGSVRKAFGDETGEPVLNAHVAFDMPQDATSS